jgi:hypothetical protein
MSLSVQWLSLWHASETVTGSDPTAEIFLKNVVKMFFKPFSNEVALPAKSSTSNRFRFLPNNFFSVGPHSANKRGHARWPRLVGCTATFLVGLNLSLSLQHTWCVGACACAREREREECVRVCVSVCV